MSLLSYYEPHTDEEDKAAVDVPETEELDFASILLNPDPQPSKPSQSPSKTHNSESLFDLHPQFTSELRSTKAELSHLYKENTRLHSLISAQERHITMLNALYREQTRALGREVAELKAAIVRKCTRSSGEEEWQTKPTIETEEGTGVVEGKGRCCSVF